MLRASTGYKPEPKLSLQRSFAEYSMTKIPNRVPQCIRRVFSVDSTRRWLDALCLVLNSLSLPSLYRTLPQTWHLLGLSWAGTAPLVSRVVLALGHLTFILGQIHLMPESLSILWNKGHTESRLRSSKTSRDKQFWKASLTASVTASIFPLWTQALPDRSSPSIRSPIVSSKLDRIASWKFCCQSIEYWQIGWEC